MKTEKTWWFLEANEPGWWLESEAHGTFTQDPNKALKWPNEWSANNARRRLRHPLWLEIRNGATEHKWVEAASPEGELSDEQLAAANRAYTQALFPECSAQQLADEWARMTPAFRLNTQEAMRAAVTAALSAPTASPARANLHRLDDPK